MKKDEMKVLAEKNYGSLYSLVNRTKELYDLIKIDNLELKESLFYYLNEDIEIKYCICNKPLRLNSYNKGFYKTCCNLDCMVLSRKNTCLDKYGVESPMQVDEIKNRQINNTNYEERNKNISISLLNIPKEQREDINKRTVASFKLSKPNHKKRNPLSKETIDKIIKTHSEFDDDKKENIRNKRTDAYKAQTTNKILDSIKNLNLTYINREYNSGGSDFVYEFKCLDCNKKFFMNRQLYRNRLKKNIKICLLCNPVFGGKSKSEKELTSYIKEIYNGEVIENTRKIINGYEYDIYLPELRIAIDYNGLYWHSLREKDYHINKYNESIKNDIYFIQIWEDKWKYENKNIKDFLLNIIKGNYKYGINSNILDKSLYSEKFFNVCEHLSPSKIGFNNHTLLNENSNMFYYNVGYFTITT